MTTDTEAPAEAATLTAADRMALDFLAGCARVRILRGGYRGDLAHVTGPGLAGGVTVTTDSGVPLALPLNAVEPVSADIRA